MNIGTWVLVGAVVLAIVTAFTVLGVRWYRRTHIPWKPLPGPTGAEWYSRLDTTNPTYLADALLAAGTFLAVRTGWGHDNLAMVMARTQVYVMGSEKWQDLSGQQVAGQQVGRSLLVGPSLAGLCHELAHLCEEVLDKKVDYQHAAWPASGIATAIEDFDAWRQKRASVSLGISNALPVQFQRGMDTCRKQS